MLSKLFNLALFTAIAALATLHGCGEPASEKEADERQNVAEKFRQAMAENAPRARSEEEVARNNALMERARSVITAELVRVSPETARGSNGDHTGDARTTPVRRYQVEVLMRNTSGQAISSLAGGVHFRDQFDDPLHGLAIKRSEPLADGQSFSASGVIRVHRPEDFARAYRTDNIQVLFIADEVHFADGEVVDFP